ncbi:hypothetical protein [Krasilnikovia sp. M28-CT-15]|uniref:hypothetical protein n=1 Tax=Krasilnikovia sp. M28-CT-15 TaxID=3373540 RepID=UPI003875CC47
MAKLTVYGRDDGPIDLERDLPPHVLASPECPPDIRDARRAFEDADARRAPFADALQAVKDEPEDRAIAIRRAVRDGEEPPSPLDPIAHAERVRIATEQLNAATRVAVTAGNRYEQLIPVHRDTLRTIVAAHAPALATRAAESGRTAQADYAAAQAALDVLQMLDYSYVGTEPDETRRVRMEHTVGAHYHRVEKADPRNEPGRPMRMAMSWHDVLAVTAGIPADIAVRDPLAEPDEAVASAHARYLAVPVDDRGREPIVLDGQPRR